MEKHCKVIFLENINGIIKTKNKNGNLFITSDKEIKEGDWVYNSISNELEKWSYKGWIEAPDFEYLGYFKIIATTDTSLISINEQYFDANKSRKSAVLKQKTLPQIPQQFIEKWIEEYNKGNVITKVMVEYVCKSNASLGHNEYVYLEHIDGKRYIPIKIDANINQDSFTLGKEEEFEDWEIETTLKVNSDNTISIKPIKDSWSREEVIEFTTRLRWFINKEKRTIFEINKWIKENL